MNAFKYLKDTGNRMILTWYRMISIMDINLHARAARLYESLLNYHTVFSEIYYIPRLFRKSPLCASAP